MRTSASGSSARGAGLFFAISLALCLTIFWPAATGRALLAPLDLAPNLFSKYRYVDPAANGIPANHYVVDLILGDVSRNWLVHQGWRRGEMPWWDPYIEGGRPLAAEAHGVNVSDPFKVVIFHLLPFELAYNWIRIVTFVVCGICAFLLLRHLGFSLSASLWGALLYQFAGCNAIMFSGPTVQAAFSWIPLLWLLWDKAASDGRFFWFVVSAPVAGLVFLSGNLQSHSYPFLLAAGFSLGYGWRQPRRFAFLALGLGGSLALGLCLAAPFIFMQIELLLNSIRIISAGYSPREMLSGPLSVVTFFPWIIGTFRTLDAGKIIGQNSLGFWIYIGSAALVIAALGATLRPVPGSRERDIRRTALALVAIYLVICSTPLLRMFYTRTAWLAVLGLVVCFAMGWDRLVSIDSPHKRWGRIVILLAILAALATNIGGLLVYPRFQDRIESYVLKQQSKNIDLDEATALRKFQVANFPNEVTFRNREPLAAFLGLIALGLFLQYPPTRRRQICLAGILVLNSLPLLWFAHRFIPQHPIALWEKIRDGGPEQHRTAALLKERGLRLRESAPGAYDFVFPGSLGHFYGVHSLQGHSSLKILNAGFINAADGQPDPIFYNVLYQSPAKGLERGDLAVRAGEQAARFRWADKSTRSIEIADETLNTITLRIGPGPAADLIRTDTYYPGWQVSPETPGVKMAFESPCFARLSVPPNVSRVKLFYEPRGLRLGISIAVGAAILICCWVLVGRRQNRMAPY